MEKEDFEDFIDQHNLKFKVKQVFKVELKKGSKSMTIFIDKKKEPKQHQIMKQLYDEALEIESAEDFEEWAKDVKLDPDSREAEAVYKDLEAQTDTLEIVLGKDVYNEFIGADKEEDEEEEDEEDDEDQ